MAKIEEARVRQKAATLAEWNDIPLPSLDGEQLFVRSEVDGKVIGFKLGTEGKTFNQLDYPDFTTRGKVDTTSSWAGRQSGVYIPVESGDYNGTTVNISDGYQVLYWDGTTIDKVIYPVEYKNIDFGGVIDDTADLSNPTKPIWYFAKAGTYNTVPTITLTDPISILTWDETSWSYSPIDFRVESGMMVFDTIADVRAMSAQQKEFIISGQVNGVTVNGYYAKGDTPAPVQYFVTDTGTDDGLSILVVGTLKLKKDFGDYIHVAYAGVKGDGTTDNTSRYNAIINASVPNGTVEWSGNMTYKGSFVTGKPLTLLGNNSIHKNSNATAPIIRQQGVTTIGKTTLTSAVGYGATSIVVASAAGIAAGDIITIYDAKARPADNLKVNYETLQVKSVSGNTINVYDMVRSEQNLTPITLDLTKPIKSCRAFDFSFVSDDTHIGGDAMQLSFIGCEDAIARNITTINNSGNAIGVRRCINFEVSNVTHYKPFSNGSGQGYGTTSNWSRNGYIFNITGYEMRHVIDYTGSYSVEMDTVYDYNSFLPIQLAHNTFGGNLIARNIFAEGQSYAAVHIQGQGVEKNYNHVFRDLIIENVTHKISDKNSDSIRSVRIESSVDNVQINNIKLINSSADYDANLAANAFDAVVSIYDAIIYGSVDIKNVYSNKIALGVLHYLSTANAANIGLINIDGVTLKKAKNVAQLGGTTRVSVDGISVAGALTSPEALFNIGGTGVMTYFNMGNAIFSDFSAPIFQGTLPTALMSGIKSQVNLSNNSALTVVSNMQVTATQLDKRTQLNLTHNFAGNITMLSDKVFPDPTHWGQRIIIVLNTPQAIGTLGDMIIPNTNTNILNVDGTYGVTIKTGEPITLIGSFVSGAKVWLVEKFNYKATTGAVGAVKQGVAVADVSSATATDLATALTLVNELKTKLNAKLLADRNSGQQSV